MSHLTVPPGNFSIDKSILSISKSGGDVQERSPALTKNLEQFYLYPLGGRRTCCGRRSLPLWRGRKLYVQDTAVVGRRLAFIAMLGYPGYPPKKCNIYFYELPMFQKNKIEKAFSIRSCLLVSTECDGAGKGSSTQTGGRTRAMFCRPIYRCHNAKKRPLVFANLI